MDGKSPPCLAVALFSDKLPIRRDEGGATSGFLFIEKVSQPPIQNAWDAVVRPAPAASQKIASDAIFDFIPNEN